MIERRPWYHLKCPVQKYAWGSKSQDSILRKLAAVKHATLQPEDPAAELWMGAHPSAPSIIVPEDVPLNSAIAADPDYMIGNRGTLSFLFKILHAGSPLSIQAHPDKSLAEILHARDPANYPDGNHKPELALCLKGMRALVGFRDFNEIHGELERRLALQPLTNFLEANGSEVERLKHWYAAIMRARPESVETAALALQAQIKTANSVEQCFLDLSRQYGLRDPGIFAPFFLNLMEFAPGEGIFLGPNEPHSYLGGEILECMAASDNVVRAGLTPKFCDVDTLLSMLTYRMGLHKTVLEANGTYAVPVDDFLLKRVSSPMEHSGHPAILIVIKGLVEIRDQVEHSKKSAEGLVEGDVVFLPVKSTVVLQPSAGTEAFLCQTAGTFLP
ncbi:MAG: mannose-6-phosphate isomerase, class I [Spirochaetia bacterium]|nr:mannose-6-phosphate isomerase, class I [Spirochaetia bacterium]